MNNVKDLEEKTRYFTSYINEMNNYVSGKSEEDFRKDGVSPLEQHLISIQLMSMTSAMIAMNDRLAILRSKNTPKSEVIESTPVIEPEIEI